MTTAMPAQSKGRFRLPDPPQREPDELTNYDHLHKAGNALHLARHFGNPETTLVEAERWMVSDPEADRSRARRPDLLVAFDVDPVMYEANNGYVVSEQGKPPDFVLEVASISTARVDVIDKRAEYAALGILEYWRFDKTGEYHGARLAGDRLVNEVYVPLPIEELPDGSLQGYSAALKLYLRWEQGQLAWYDPVTGRHILTYDDQKAMADSERARADTAEAGWNRERARVRELEAELRRLETGDQ